ncbi:MAG: fatty-acid oxidation protein subunit alpha, partial [Fibrella sp.]|nr:fatty-acid oxidation protein subunit alpha [Armatimonadota bacterium]
MPALDKFHHIVKNALVKDGWTVTDDPLSLRYEDKNLFVDFG